jgi:hypothetical protein
MTAILLSILCYSTGHPVLGTVSLVYGILKALLWIPITIFKIAAIVQ